MEGWKKYRLGDVLCEKGYIRGPFGSALKRGDLLDEGIPVYEQQHAIYNRRDFRFYINEEKYNEMKRFTVYPEDIIISCSGTVGEVSLINKEDPLGIISQALLLLRANISIILPEYLLYFFKTAKGHNSITSRSSGSVQVNIAKREVIESIPLYIPNIEIQSRIVNILRSLDDKIAVNKKICENLEAQAQALFKHWFVDFEPFKGGEFEESELGMIPKGWRVASFIDYINVMPGGTPSTGVSEYWENGTIPFFSPKDVQGVYCFDTEKHITEEGLAHCASKLYPRDTLFITARGTVGKIALAAVPMAMNQSNYALVSKEKTIKFFLYLLTQTLVTVLLKKANGAVFSAITTKDLNERVVFPPVDIISRFEEIVKPMFENLYCITNESRRLASLRDTLLPRLMSGELKVDEIEKENLSNSTRL